MPAAYSATARRAPFWRAFSPADCQQIDHTMSTGRTPCCPGCGTTLQARAESRMARCLPEGTSAIDLECRWCLRFRCVARKTAGGERLERMRRLAAAVQAAGTAPRRPGRAAARA
jgi:hypothetical protein